MTVTLVEQAPLFVESWEARMRSACIEYRRAGAVVEARYRSRPMQNPTRAEMQSFYDARFRVRKLVWEVGE